MDKALTTDRLRRTARADRGDRQPGAGAIRRLHLAVGNMNCGGCMRKVERVLGATPGVRAARANLSAKRVSIEFDGARIDDDGLVKVLAEAGYKAAALLDDRGDASNDTGDLLKRLAVAGFAAANIMLLSVSVWAGIASDMDASVQHLFHWISALIALPAVAYSGQPFFRSALTALKAFRLNMDVPISLALLLALAMSLYQTSQGSDQVYFDASVSLCFFLLIGRYLDHSLRKRAKGAAQNLLSLKSSYASVVGKDGTVGRLASHLLRPGMRVLVAPGERIPVDGRVVAGRADIDEQLITGETIPRTVGENGQVFAGTIALNAPLEVELTAADENTLLAEIGRLMEAAEQSRGRYVRLADRAAALYAPAVHALGLATFIGWMLAGAGWEPALIYAIAVLIITCPCALALAVPAVQVAASARLFDNNVILTAPDALERIAEVDTLVLDKTGTLTFGTPRLVNGRDIGAKDLEAAARLAANSKHPFAVALVEAARARGLSVLPASGVIETVGSGLSRRHEDGREERLGSAAWCGSPNDGDGPAGGDARPAIYYRGKSVEGEKIVEFQLEDELRPDARSMVQAARKAGLDVILLSGDRSRTVSQSAVSAGIAHFFAEQRPADKVALLEKLKSAGRRVLMVGDGLNDAPSLAAAHASLSPAGAIALSQMASDGIVQGARLAPVTMTIAIARRAKRMAFENFAIAAAYNAVCIPLAMFGFVTPLVAALAMSASSIAVTANALRLRTMRAELKS